MEMELKRWFIQYFKYLEKSNSSFFCENIGILEHCARDRIEYQWEDRILDNLKIVEDRYPDLYAKMLKHLFTWLHKVEEAHNKNQKKAKGALIFLDNYK